MSHVVIYKYLGFVYFQILDLVNRHFLDMSKESTIGFRLGSSQEE